MWCISSRSPAPRESQLRDREARWHHPRGDTSHSVPADRPGSAAVPGVSVRSPSRRSLCTLQRPPAEIRAEVPGVSIWTRYWEWGAGHERGRLLKRIRTIDALGPALGERCAFASRWRPAGGSVQSTLTRLVSARGRRATQIRRASSARRNIVSHGDQGPQMRVSASHRQRCRSIVWP
jgi:hypothetical protein